MSSSTHTSPVELALTNALHHLAGGATSDALLRVVATAAQQAMGSTSASAAVVLGAPEGILAVHATANPPEGGGAVVVPEAVLLTGPAQTTASSGAVSTVDDVRTPNVRWPEWAVTARAAGVVGVRCWPVRVANRPVGSLVVLTTDPWSGPTRSEASLSGGRSSAAGQALADVCSVVLQLPPPGQRWTQVLTHLRSVVEVDVVVHQAVGMIAAAHEVAIPVAAAALAANATRRQVTVSDLARHVVERTVPASDIAPG